MSRIEISNVPPPKSYTAIFSFFFLSRPYASEAAVGSFTMRFTSRPAMRPASFVAWRCESLKYAGTVMTASVIFSPRNASASVFSFCRIIALISISCGLYVLSPTFTAASPFAAGTTSYGTILRSASISS